MSHTKSAAPKAVKIGQPSASLPNEIAETDGLKVPEAIHPLGNGLFALARGGIVRRKLDALGVVEWWAKTSMKEEEFDRAFRATVCIVIPDFPKLVLSAIKPKPEKEPDRHPDVARFKGQLADSLKEWLANLNNQDKIRFGLAMSILGQEVMQEAAKAVCAASPCLIERKGKGGAK